jgi:vanillate O-demethylase monooxygenase subunit
MDNFMAYDYLLPGILLMQTGVFPLGTAKACDFGYPDLSRAVGSLSFTSQAVTPVTEKTLVISSRGVRTGTSATKRPAMA